MIFSIWIFCVPHFNGTWCLILFSSSLKVCLKQEACAVLAAPSADRRTLCHIASTCKHFCPYTGTFVGSHMVFPMEYNFSHCTCVAEGTRGSVKAPKDLIPFSHRRSVRY